MSLTLNLNNCPDITATVCFGLDSNNVYVGVGTNVLINNGAWHQIIGVWSSVSGTDVSPSEFQIYVDGVAASPTSEATIGGVSPPLTGSGGTILAGDEVSGWSGLDGAEAGVAVFTHALSASQVSTLYKAGQ